MTTPAIVAAVTVAPPADENAYTNTSKPFDVLARPLHRVKSPTYDVTIDTPNAPGLETKDPPDGDAAKAGARNPTMFLASEIFQDFIRTLEKTLEKVLGVAPFLAAIDELLKKVTGKAQIEELRKAIAKAIAQSIEGALFDRYMRVIPAWVPVDRLKYGPKFLYKELRSSPRATSVEEEREVEGLVTASYQQCNSIPNTQWSHYWHWAFHVRPLPGYRHLIGRGNRRVGIELNEIGTDQSKRKLREVLHIYGQIDQNVDNGTDVGAIECLWDVGGMSKPRGDGGTDGVMFHGNFPFWPQMGDHIWVAGRFVYDCARVITDSGEFSPSLLNPCKALAVARFEGFKFPENAGGVPAVKFFFLATTEGGYFNFRPVDDRLKKKHHEQNGTNADQSPKFNGINLRDRDYEFILDLPPTDETRGIYPIGRTTGVMENTLVLRPRLLAQFRFAPFETKNSTQDRPVDVPPWADGMFFHKIDVPDNLTIDPKQDIRPRIEIIPEADPFAAPRQVRIRIPMKSLPLPPTALANRPEVYGVELALGWYDPDGSEAAKLTKVDVEIKHLRMHGSHSTKTVHFKACVNGQWRSIQTVSKISNVPTDPSQPRDPNVRDPTTQDIAPDFQKVSLFLPAGARIAVTTHGSWRHGYGEFMERNTQKRRELEFGGLVQLPSFIDDELQDLRALAKKLGPALPADQRKRLDELEEILKVLDNFIGKKTTADWLVDIDNDRTDDQKSTNGSTLTDFQKQTIEQERVSALARALFVDPISTFNQNDEPLGWATFVDPTNTRLTTVGTMSPSPAQIGTVEKLLAEQQRTGQRVTHVNVFANRMWQLGAGNNLGMQIAEYRGEKQIIDYSMEIELSATPGVKPAPPPAPPPPPPLPPDNTTDPQIIPASVTVRSALGPSINPSSVSVTQATGPSINPASVTVKPSASPVIAPASVTVTVRRRGS